jgi:hypothetical protein
MVALRLNERLHKLGAIFSAVWATANAFAVVVIFFENFFLSHYLAHVIPFAILSR